MRPRLASKILANALIRRAESLGGFGMVVARGDPTAGAILLILTERGQKFGAMERVLETSGEYAWQLNEVQDTENKQEIEDLVQRRRKYDPDLWVLELDIPSPERFAAEMTAFN
jgi:hypothetical protein